jgi:hypothetical protein
MKIGLPHMSRFTRWFAFALCLGVCGIASSQTVTVQLVNGRNGKPLANVKVQIGFDDLKGRQPLILNSNRNGEVQFETDGSKTYEVHPVGLVACGEQPIGVPFRQYSITDTLKTGLLTQNNCGRINSEPFRGRLLYFGRHATWWELLKN